MPAWPDIGIYEIHCFPISKELKKFKNLKKTKKTKKVKKARVPESSNAQSIPGQYQGPADPDQRIPTPDNAISPRQSLTVANINDFFYFSYVYPMPAWPDIGKYR